MLVSSWGSLYEGLQDCNKTGCFHTKEQEAMAANYSWLFSVRVVYVKSNSTKIKRETRNTSRMIGISSRLSEGWAGPPLLF